MRTDIGFSSLRTADSKTFNIDLAGEPSSEFNKENPVERIGKMARLIAGTLTALLLLSSSLAPSQTKGTSSSTLSSPLTGCLVKAGDGYKVRNAKYPRGVEVSLPDGYQGDVGYTVTLSGHWGVYPGSGGSGTIRIGEGGQATMTNLVPVLEVSGVTNIGKACAPSAGASPKVVPGGGKAAPPMRATIPPDVAAGMILQKATPVYPPIARAARVSGTVVLRAVISKGGMIEDVHVISGPTMLQEAALEAVRTWRYRPYLLSNKPVEVETTINVVFTPGG